MPAITQLVNIPSIDDPDNFAAEADDLLSNQFPTMIDELNAALANLSLISTTDTSASSVAIGTGAKTFTVSSGKSFVGGMFLMIADTAAPSTNYMYGQVTSYSGTSLVMNITAVGGSGTKTAWTISQSATGILGGGVVAGLGTNTFSGDQILSSGAALEESISTVASATTPDLWTSTSNKINYTGTTTATGIATAPQAGVSRTLILAGAASFTAGANLLIDGYSTGQTYTGAAGDEVTVTAVTTTQNRLRIKKADGTAVVVRPPRNHIEGLILSTAGASTTMTVSAGECADSTNTVMLTLASAINKTTGAWAVGSGNGGLDEGTIANSKAYSFYEIRRPDTDVKDVIFGLSPDTSATVTITIATPAVITWADHGLQSNASVVFTTTGALPTGLTAGTRYYVSATGLTANTFQVSATQGGAVINTSGSQSGVHTATSAPAMPANYTQRRRIGFGLTNASGQWLKVDQVGDVFTPATPLISASNVTIAITKALLTLGVPTGVRLEARLQILVANAATRSVRLYADADDDLTVTDDNATSSNSASATRTTMSKSVNTNRSGQIATRSDVSTTGVYIQTLAWVDKRGRE